MARECPVKGKGKGDMKGGGKGVAKGGFKGAFKGKGGLKGEGGSKGGGGKGEGKGYGKGQLGVKGAGKGLGYQGQCWTCGRIGHKSAECNVYMVGDVEQGTDVDAVNRVDEEPWIVGSVTEAPKEGVWSKTKKVAREKVKFMQGYGGPMKISTACVSGQTRVVAAPAMTVPDRHGSGAGATLRPPRCGPSPPQGAALERNSPPFRRMGFRSKG